MLLRLVATFLVYLIPIQAQAVHVSSKEAHIDINTQKVLHIKRDIDLTALARFEMEYLATKHMKGDRVIIISSPGGYVSVGEEMLRIVLKEKNSGTRIVCVVDRDASSMAFNILSYCDVRLAKREARMVVHKIRAFDIQGILTVKELRRIADEMEKAGQVYDDKNAKEMKLTKAEYDMWADLESNWPPKVLFDRGYLHGFVDEMEE